MSKSRDKKRWIIAIDGPSAAGKSTLGKALARRYDLIYIDTGAMYRAVAWLALKMGIPWSDENALVDLVESKSIEMGMKNDSISVSIDDNEVTDVIRTPEIGSGRQR